MKLISFLLFCLLAHIVDASQIHFGLSLRAAHLRVKAHTHSLARDLRFAFGGTLLPRSNYQSQQVIYCKALGNSDSGATSTPNATSSTPNNASSSAGTGTKTVSGTSSPNPTVPASPWKLAESHVTI